MTWKSFFVNQGIKQFKRLKYFQSFETSPSVEKVVGNSADLNLPECCFVVPSAASVFSISPKSA